MTPVRKVMVIKRMYVFGVFFAIAGFLVSLISVSSVLVGTYFKPEQEGLSKQIREVEGAITDLRNLESYLEKTKSDIIATEEAKIKIEEEYEKAKELEKLTENQIEAISLAVNKRTKTDIIKNYFWGWVLGVSSSLLATYIYGFIKRRKTQTKL